MRPPYRRLVALLSTSVLALGLAPARPASAADPVAALDATISALLATSGATAMSVRADVAGRGTVFTHASTTPVAPASTEKLVTAYTALRVLGPANRFATGIGSLVAPDSHGVLHGRLVVTAGGDPTLTTDGLDRLAAQVRHLGVVKVTGGIELDDTLFSRVRRAPGWKPEWVPDELGPLSAFAVDGNAWRTDAGYLADPSIGNLEALRQALTGAGVQVSGPLTVGGPVTPVHRLAVVDSPPLAAIVEDMLKRSVNFDAEMLLEAVGATVGRGTPAGGVTVIRSQVAALKLALPGNIVDGSGLSRDDTESAAGEVTWLEAIAADRLRGRIIYAGLPVGCVDGTLAHRQLLCGMAHPVHAKTGTLDGTRALSGFVTDAAGHQVTFAFLVEGPLSTQAAATHAIDASVVALAAGRL